MMHLVQMLCRIIRCTLENWKIKDSMNAVLMRKLKVLSKKLVGKIYRNVLQTFVSQPKIPKIISFLQCDVS